MFLKTTQQNGKPVTLNFNEISSVRPSINLQKGCLITLTEAAKKVYRELGAFINPENGASILCKEPYEDVIARLPEHIPAEPVQK